MIGNKNRSISSRKFVSRNLPATRELSRAVCNTYHQFAMVNICNRDVVTTDPHREWMTGSMNRVASEIKLQKDHKRVRAALGAKSERCTAECDMSICG